MRSFLGRILAWLALLGGFLVLFWSGHRAAYSVWLNAHPLYDDAYWAEQFNRYFTIFAAALVVELAAVWWLIRLRRGRRVSLAP